MLKCYLGGNEYGIKKKTLYTGGQSPGGKPEKHCWILIKLNELLWQIVDLLISLYLD